MTMTAVSGDTLLLTRACSTLPAPFPACPRCRRGLLPPLQHDVHRGFRQLRPVPQVSLCLLQPLQRRVAPRCVSASGQIALC